MHLGPVLTNTSPLSACNNVFGKSASCNPPPICMMSAKVVAVTFPVLPVAFARTVFPEQLLFCSLTHHCCLILSNHLLHQILLLAELASPRSAWIIPTAFALVDRLHIQFALSNRGICFHISIYNRICSYSKVNFCFCRCSVYMNVDISDVATSTPVPNSFIGTINDLRHLRHLN